MSRIIKRRMKWLIFCVTTRLMMCLTICFAASSCARPVRFEGQQEVQIKVDVSEDDKAYTVHAEIPGVKKEDIHVTIDGNQVFISAEVKNEKETKEGEKVLRSERYYGKVSRAFTLAQDVDEASA